MASDDRFVSCWEKFRRAEQHIDEMERRIKEFYASDPYSIVAEDKPETGQRVFKVAKTTPLPNDLPLILGDAVHNARSAFDHFAYRVVPNPTSDTAFPVHRKGSPSKKDPMKGKVNGKLKGASSELLKAITSCGPYEGGAANCLWTLDYLDIMDKHMLLVPIATAYSSLTLDIGHFPGLGYVPGFELTLLPADRCRIEDGTELLVTPIEGSAEAERDTKFTFDIALYQPQSLKSEPVVPALRSLLDEAKELLKRLIPLA